MGPAERVAQEIAFTGDEANFPVWKAKFFALMNLSDLQVVKVGGEVELRDTGERKKLNERSICSC